MTVVLVQKRSSRPVKTGLFRICWWHAVDHAVCTYHRESPYPPRRPALKCGGEQRLP